MSDITFVPFDNRPLPKSRDTRPSGGVFPCPECGSNANWVTDTRWSDSKQGVRRRRACYDCNLRWTTYEHTAKSHAFNDAGIDI